MTISYPITLPSLVKFTKSKFTSDAAVSISESPFTFEQQVYAHQGQRWRATLTAPPMRRPVAEQWNAAMVSLNGRQGTFLLGDPDATKPRGQGTGAPTVSGGGQTGNSLVTTGWTYNKTGIMLAGDYIQLGSGATARLHKVLADTNSDGTGSATLSIWPNLRTSPNNGDPVSVLNCCTQFRLDTTWAWDADEISTYGFSFSCTEAL